MNRLIIQKKHQHIYSLLPLLSLMLILSLFSCEYSPSGDAYKDIEEPEVESISVELNFNDSVIVTNGTTYLTYDISFIKQEVELVECYVDGEVYHTSRSKSGSIELNYRSISEGNHEFEMIVYASTNSGSLADRLGAEQILYTSDWKLVMLDRESLSLDITNISLVDGQLKIEWEKFDNFSFENYTLIKNGRDYYTIDNVNVGVYVDSEYVGGPVSYQLRLRAGKQEQLGEDKSFNLIDSVSIIEIDSLSMAHISWSKCKAYGSFSHYTIYIQHSNDGQTRRDKIAEITEIDDTTISIPWGINTNRKIIVRYCHKNSKDLYYEDDAYEKSRGAWSVKRVGFWGELAQSIYPPYNIYSISLSYWDYVYNTETGSVIKQDSEANSGLAVSPNNSRLVAEFYTLNPSSMKITDTYDYVKANSIEGFFAGPISLAQNDLAVVRNYYTQFLYDFSNKRFLGILDTKFNKVNISPNGDFVVGVTEDKLRIYTIKDREELLLSKSLGGTYSSLFFIGDTVRSDFLVKHDDKIEHWSCDNLSLEKSKELDIDRILALDPVSNTFVGKKDNIFKIYDTNSFDFLRQYIVYDEVYYIRDDVFFIAYLNYTLLIDGRIFKVTL